MNNWRFVKPLLIVSIILFNILINCQPENVYITKIDINPKPDQLLTIGDTLQFIIIANYDDGSVIDITQKVEWVIDYGNGYIDKDGIFNATKEGLSHITAVFEGVKSETIKIGVVNPENTRVNLKMFPSKDRYLLIGYPIQYFTFLKFENSEYNLKVTSGIEWIYSNNHLQYNDSGIFTALSSGKTNIEARLNKYNLITQSGDITIIELQEDDPDGDMLSIEMEEAFNTDPNNPDTDNDMLSDGLEVFGLPGLDLPAYGCNPVRKDLLIHLDWMVEREGVEYIPKQAILDQIVQNFSEAGIINPDGSSGISLHIDAGNRSSGYPIEFAEGGNLIPFKESMNGLNYADFYKDLNQTSIKRNVVRYGLIGNRYNDSDSSGLAYLFGYTFIVTLYEYTGYDALLIGTLIHEFGHNIGLHHAGVHPRPNYKPNYNSVMNYAYQFSGIDIDGDITGDGVEATEEAEDYLNIFCGNCYTYSSGKLLTLDENHLNEFEGVNNIVSIDWNGNNILETDIKEDINIDKNNEGDELYEILYDHNDWANLTYQETLHTIQDKFSEYSGEIRINYDYSTIYDLPEQECPLPFK